MLRRITAIMSSSEKPRNLSYCGFLVLLLHDSLEGIFSEVEHLISILSLCSNDILFILLQLWKHHFRPGVGTIVFHTQRSKTKPKPSFQLLILTVPSSLKNEHTQHCHRTNLREQNRERSRFLVPYSGLLHIPGPGKAYLAHALSSSTHTDSSLAS